MSQLPHYNYPANTLLEIDGAQYHPQPSPVPGRLHLIHVITGQPFLCPDHDGTISYPTPEALDELKIQGRLREIYPEPLLNAQKIAAKTEWDHSDCLALDPGSEKMLVQCELLDENNVPNGIKAMQIALPHLWTDELRQKYGEHDNIHNIRRWRSERGVKGRRTCKDMVRMNGKVPRAPWLNDVVEQIKQKHAMRCAATEGSFIDHLALASAELTLVNNGHHPFYPAPDTPYRCFSYATFRRACRKIIGSEIDEARHGPDYVEAKHKGAGKKLTANRILQRVIIDHTELDCFIVSDEAKPWCAERAWLTLAIDVHSRACLAALVTLLPPSYWTVFEIVRRMLLPKRPPSRLVERFPILRRLCGRPTEIIVDNGVEFRCKSMRDFARSTGISIRHAPIKKPRYKAIGERAFGTIPVWLLEGLPGHTKSIQYNRIAKNEPQAKAEVTLLGLEARANWTTGEYNVAPHEGIDNRPPALMFQNSANAHGIDVMCDIRAAMINIMEVEENVRITNSGARIFGLRYHSVRNVPTLLNDNLRFEPRRKKDDAVGITTKVKFDPSNIATVHAWNRHTRTYVTLECEDASYSDGMPLAFHQSLMERAAAEGRAFCSEDERLEFRAVRIAAIKDVAPKAKAREKAELARLYEHPRIRQLTGNIVSVDFDVAEAVPTDGFITHDQASQTAFDVEVMTGAPPRHRRTPAKGRSDRRSLPDTASKGDAAPIKRNKRSRAAGGEYAA
ncbi:transposase family protein [Sphingomonas sp. KRR8]|uniref:integrase catalytic domain-containing protein n=1 Tax=Sphingomonas sp. KRR8 TaxID=2942996 RepID=UPI0020212093|nr:transposase family protein [Sphingomonas sp. KRR8]URD61086.1 transposase family protein [Sphingomonas sp. KRR8]